jgi:uncharacterized protein
MRLLTAVVSLLLMAMPMPCVAQDGLADLEAGCVAGDAEACLTLAEALHKAGGPDRIERARAMFANLCKRRVDQACFDLAVLHDESGGPGDSKKAARLYTTACRRGHQDACYNLAVGQEKSGAFAKAYKGYASVCAAGTLAGCVTLGFHFEWGGEKLPQDEGRALALYMQACDGGDGLGCTSLASMYADGRGVPKDLARARELNDASCKAGNMTGCSKLGLMLERGQGGDKDADAAQALYGRACKGGVRMACDLKR